MRWTLVKAEISQIRFMRLLFGVTRTDDVRNKNILQELLKGSMIYEISEAPSEMVGARTSGDSKSSTQSSNKIRYWKRRNIGNT
jgi:hypothetical protein